MDGGLLKYAAFTGRASRREFAVAFAVSVVLTLTSLLPGLAPGPNIWITAVYWLVYIASNWILLAAAVRRQHDLGKSAWLILLSPIVGFVLLIWWFFRPGMASANRYGLPPAA